MQMIAIQPMEYAGRQYAPGERVEVRDEFVNLQLRLGRARLAKPRSYRTRQMLAETAPRAAEE